MANGPVVRRTSRHGGTRSDSCATPSRLHDTAYHLSGVRQMERPTALHGKSVSGALRMKMTLASQPAEGIVLGHA